MQVRSFSAFTVIVASAGLLLSGVATASNMGFALNLSLPVEGSPSRHWVSLPWVYAPTTAKALCADLGGSAKVASVWRWDETSSSFVSYACTDTADGFSLVKASPSACRTPPARPSRRSWSAHGRSARLRSESAALVVFSGPPGRRRM